MNPTASSVEVLVPTFPSLCSEKNMNPTASSVEVLGPTFPSWCSEKNMNPTASNVEVLVPKPILKFVFKFSADKLIIKENPSDQNPVISKTLGKNSSTTDSEIENEIKRLETREKNSKSQVERKRNVSPEAEKSKSKKRRMMVSLELSEERIIADVLAMTEGKPLRRPKKNKSLVGMIHNHFTPGAMFASKKEFYPHSFPQFMDTFLHDTGDD